MHGGSEGDGLASFIRWQDMKRCGGPHDGMAVGRRFCQDWKLLLSVFKTFFFKRRNDIVVLSP